MTLRAQQWLWPRGRARVKWRTSPRKRRQRCSCRWEGGWHACSDVWLCHGMHSLMLACSHVWQYVCEAGLVQSNREAGQLSTSSCSSTAHQRTSQSSNLDAPLILTALFLAEGVTVSITIYSWCSRASNCMRAHMCKWELHASTVGHRKCTLGCSTALFRAATHHKGVTTSVTIQPCMTLSRL